MLCPNCGAVIPESDIIITHARIAKYLGVSSSYYHAKLKDRLEPILFTRTRRGWKGRRITWTFAHLLDVWLIQAKHL